MVCEPSRKPTANVELKINGQEIELNSFIMGFISETITGMIKPLRGVNNVETVELKISRKS